MQSDKMIMPNYIEIMRRGWRALGVVPEGREVQSITIVSKSNTPSGIDIKAGRLAENSSEVVLFLFDLEHLPKEASLPKANGFDLKFYTILGKNYIGISRSKNGALDLYEAMMGDILSYLPLDDAIPHKIIFKRFMDRVNAWQAFMGRARKALSRQSELGLIGELCILRKLLKFNVPAEDVINWWRGPLHGIHDFQMYGSAIEVKTTLSQEGFEIDVFNIEQLEPAGLNKLFIAAVRLEEADVGEKLPQIVQTIEDDIGSNSNARRLFKIALGHAGYSSEHDSHYSLSILTNEIMYFNVDENFPSLRRINIPKEVIKLSYKIDLGFLPVPAVDLEDVLIEMGVVNYGIS